jgi:hypothetical protein
LELVHAASPIHKSSIPFKIDRKPIFYLSIDHFFTSHVTSPSMTSDDPDDKRKRKSTLSWWTPLFTLFSIITVLLPNFIDKGPPLSPFPQNFTSIDCHSVTFESSEDCQGFLDFNFRVKSSVEYLPNFLSIQINTHPTTMTYSDDEITNITRNSSYIRFSLIHT